jgi:aspartate-semialdehyde dehydrogenase
MVVASYQAVSGAGAKAMAELEEQVKALCAGRAIRREVFPHQIAFNVIPSIGGWTPSGYSVEEVKLLNETRKIFGDREIRVTGTTVRVPVLRAHSEAINLELEKPLSAEKAREILRKAPGLKLVDDPAKEKYPMPIDATGQYDVLVGRIRRDTSVENGLDLWVAGDQLLKGAALNAVQIAELL